MIVPSVVIEPIYVLTYLEFQVDLLGDEVDTLLRLLERIYVALDHYSHILQHYPGVRIFPFLLIFLMSVHIRMGVANVTNCGMKVIQLWLEIICNGN